MSGDPVVSWMRDEKRKERLTAGLVGLLGVLVTALLCVGVAVIL